ncbi:hypothetical protein ACS0TY_005519 [Phlomoides rotata]
MPFQAMKEHGFTEKRIQLLRDITAAFRPGILTALMGVSGAGKMTLLDVISGRKTSGTIEGEIRIGGFPKVQTTFAQILGYCEQTDIHSQQITVQESVLFSAWLRLDPHIESTTKYEFVKQVLERIELDSIKDALVGLPGVDGLSTEQRKRLTIAVELISNPSIIFMDEPTTGVDARAAAVVMRAVKNVANTRRTIVCTIHQPSIDIFEAFDELLLLKARGRMSYYGPLGHQSCKVIEYFEGISGVPRIRDNYNPAAWMLEVTSASSEIELSIDFAEIYSKSSLHENNKEVVKKLSKAPSGSTDVHFATRYAQNGLGQFKPCLWKQHLSYWRSPKYNLMRSLHMLFAAFIFGVLFWGQGKKIDNQQSLFTVLGSMYASALFCGINNSSSVLPYVSTERSVVYRERFAGMYASWAYSAAHVVIEIPYLFAQAVAFTAITYPMIGYYWSAYKVLWYLYTMFCTLLYFTYLGMMLVSITPSFPVAAILQSAFYTMLNLFSGFLIPHPQIPRWWIWFYYVVPTSWSLNGMLTSQFGDIHDQITVFGQTKTVAAFLRDYFGYQHHLLPLVAVMLLLYPVVFALLFAFCIANFNFQRRACMSREFLLMKRNSFLYVFKSVQLVLIASITMIVFLRTDMGVDIVHANNYLGALFYSLLILLFDGMPELSLTVARLAIFYKQRDFHFYPAWAYAIPATILKIPLSFLQALLWTSLTYFVIGYTPDVGRFFRQLVLLFAVHMASISMFRFLASVFRTVVAATTAGSLAILFVMFFSGFMIQRPSMPVWLKLAFWLSPLSYGEIGLSSNEFLAPRWQKEVVGNTTLGHQTLANRGLNFGGNLFWLLRDILTALMGVSGAGKTTLLDILSGRKTSGTIEGEIRIGGFPKVQTTFAQILGYCEQTDIHSQQITVQESVLFSAWLRLDPHIESTTKYEFVKQVLGRIELDSIKDALVGLPSVDGLSTEQRKRLTIAVELVSNPSIISMDEPTTGLDARAAAVVMRAVKNVANTGRTIVCTIHQPSIDIFEAFDELLLLKAGGRMSYYGPLGQQSCKLIDYFEGISGVPRIRDNYNPAAWMLEVTSASSEIELSIDFAEIYSKSSLHENNKEVVKKLSKAPSGSTDVHFATRYAQNGWG